MKKIIRDQAREMRQNGETITGIAKALNVSKGTISLWVRDITLTEAQVEAIRVKKSHFAAQNKGSQANRSKFLVLRQQYQHEGRERAREARPLHMAGCMLYWAEGAKARNNFYFVNSDPNMMRLMMRFLREEMGIRDNECRLKIHCHFPDRETQERIEQYWVDLLQLPISAVGKTQHKKGSEFHKNILVNGVCGIAVYKSQLVQHIFGAIQEYAGFDNPVWLL